MHRNSTADTDAKCGMSETLAAPWLLGGIHNGRKPEHCTLAWHSVAVALCVAFNFKIPFAFSGAARLPCALLHMNTDHGDKYTGTARVCASPDLMLVYVVHFPLQG